MSTKLDKKLLAAVLMVISCTVLMVLLKLAWGGNSYCFCGEYTITDGIDYSLEYDSSSEPLSISGWAVYPEHNQNIELYNKQIWLEDEGGKFIVYKTKTIPRRDLKDLFSSEYGAEYDFTYCGFSTSINTEELPKGRYNIYICYSYLYDNMLVHAGVFINE